MRELTAYCGLQCHDCNFYLISREEDEAKRERIRRDTLRICNEQYGMGLTLEDITECDGCTTAGGRLFAGCSKCKVRACVTKKGFESCAFCPECPCPELEEVHKLDSQARDRLDQIRSGKPGRETS
ncbi:MAG TPA: DUF3795 domain-containing protein [Acidobacteriota bacterium]|nr:DUF3795 domain-containing protein [Acidobacteriota bacterium]